MTTFSLKIENVNYNLLTFEKGDTFPAFDLPKGAKLTQSQLQKIDRPSNEEQHDEVRNQESSSPIFVRGHGKSPNIT